MGTEYAAVALGALSTGIGGLVLFILGGLRSDIHEIRNKVDEHSDTIRELVTKDRLRRLDDYQRES